MGYSIVLDKTELEEEEHKKTFLDVPENWPT